MIEGYNLFWIDEESQMNYKVFGDIVAFDAHTKRTRICVHW
jgi:hypothetical protein